MILTSGVTVTGDETPLVIGTQRDLTCTATGIIVSTIQWKIVIAGFEPTLSSGTNVNQLTIQPFPFQTGSQMYKCVVVSTSGQTYSADALLTIQGEFFVLS